MSEATVEVRYTCGLCAVVDRPVTVRARRCEENVVDWLRVVAAALAADHAAVTPGCRPATFRNLKIPLVGVQRVGDPVRH